MEMAATSSEDDIEEAHAVWAPHGVLFAAGEGYHGWSSMGHHDEEDGLWLQRKAVETLRA